MGLSLPLPSGRSTCVSAILLMLVTLLATGCASTTRTTHTTMPSIQESSSEKDPSNKVANLSHDQLILKADSYRQNDNQQLAILHYRKALDKKPQSTVAAIGLSKMLIRQGNLEEAAQLLKNILKNDEHNVPALLLMGSIARDRGDLTRSLEWLTKAYVESPANPVVLTELAITNDHIGQERLTYAEPLYKKVISLKPHSSAAHNNLGFNYLLQGRHAEAVKTFNRALALAPGNKRTTNNLAAAYLLNKQTDEALKLFQNTVGLAAAYNNLGYILMTRGDWQQAEKAFKKALQLNPSFYVRAQENLEHLEHLHSTTR